jgi:hypothetical protein
MCIREQVFVLDFLCLCLCPSPCSETNRFTRYYTLITYGACKRRKPLKGWNSALTPYPRNRAILCALQLVLVGILSNSLTASSCSSRILPLADFYPEELY